MKKGPIATALVLGGIALMLSPPIHAMVREANTLFAMGIAHRHEADPSHPNATIAAFATELPPIPGLMHWVCFVAGALCIAAGIGIARRAPSI